jgi:DNA topoisomerase IB
MVSHIVDFEKTAYADFEYLQYCDKKFLALVVAHLRNLHEKKGKLLYNWKDENPHPHRQTLVEMYSYMKSKGKNWEADILRRASTEDFETNLCVCIEGSRQRTT